MTRQPTWWRWVAGLLAALLIAMIGPAPAFAAPICPDDAAAVVQADDFAGAAVSSPAADDACPEGCLACAHCQSHHSVANLAAGPEAAVERLAHAERLGLSRASPLRSHLTHRLKRPPRG